MDDDKQINNHPMDLSSDPTSQDKSTELAVIEQFLGKKNSQIGSPDNIYSLEDEFAASKKNKDFRFYFKIFAAAFFVTALVIIFAVYKEHKSRSIGVGFEDFKDLELSELLNTSKKKMEKMQRLKRELEDLQKELINRKDLLREEMNFEIDLLIAEDLTPSERSNRTASIRSDFSQRTRAIEKKYNKLILEKREAILKLENELAQYDAALLDSAKKAEKLIESSKKVVEIEMEKQKAYYEDRIDTMRKRFYEQMGTIKDEKKAALRDLRETRFSLEALKGQLEGYRHGIDFYAGDYPDAGYVIDPRRLDKMIVHINLHYIQGGISDLKRPFKVWIFRETEGRLIGEALVSQAEGGFTAEMIKMSKRKDGEKNSVNPFDRLLLKK